MTTAQQPGTTLAQPLFSVVMPAYNSERFIKAAVESVLQQSFRDFELIVSDDESTDATAAIVALLARGDHRVKLLHHARGGGVAANRNFVVRQAQGAWLAFLDADDLWPTEHLALYAEAISAVPQAQLLFADYCRFVDEPPTEPHGVLESKRFFDPGAEYVESVAWLASGTEIFRFSGAPLLKFCCLYHCPIQTGTVAVNRRTVETERIVFREGWSINEDFHFWMRMLELGQAAAVRRVTGYYRLNPDSLTGDPIRYFEGMAISHRDWMRRITDRLDDNERRVYRDKVAGFLQAAAWQHSLRGQALAATWAQARSLRVRRRLSDVLGVPRTFLRALWWRSRREPGGASS